MRKVASIQGQVFDFAVVDDLAQLGAFRLGQVRIRFHGHGLGGGADFQHQIQGTRLGHANFDVLRHQSGKARGFCPDFVDAIGNRNHPEDSIVLRRDVSLQTGRRTNHRDLCACDSGAFLILDGAHNSALGGLCPGSGKQNIEQKNTC